MPFPSPITETVLLALIAAFALIILGIGWLVYLCRGGKPFSISISGFGIAVDLNRKNGDRSRVPSHAGEEN